MNINTLKGRALPAALATLVAIGLTVPSASRADGSQLPSFLSGTGAAPMSAEEMREIRGEGVPRWAISAAVRIAGSALGQTVAVKLQALLSRTSAPSYRDYQRAFGTRAALILSIMPPALRPHIVQ